MSVLFRSHFGSRTSQRRGLVPGSGLRPATGQGYPETRTCVSWLLARRCGSEALAWAQTCVGGAGGCGVLYPCLMEPSASTTVHPTLERGGADPPAADMALPSTPPGASASALNQEEQPPWLAAAASEGAAFATGATQMALTVMERVNRWQNTPPRAAAGSRGEDEGMARPSPGGGKSRSPYLARPRHPNAETAKQHLDLLRTLVALDETCENVLWMEGLLRDRNVLSEEAHIWRCSVSEEMVHDMLERARGIMEVRPTRPSSHFPHFHKLVLLLLNPWAVRFSSLRRGRPDSTLIWGQMEPHFQRLSQPLNPLLQEDSTHWVHSAHLLHCTLNQVIPQSSMWKWKGKVLASHRMHWTQWRHIQRLLHRAH